MMCRFQKYKKIFFEKNPASMVMGAPMALPMTMGAPMALPIESYWVSMTISIGM